MKRIHVVGPGPRTGTTLLTECMAACFQIDAYDKHEASLCEHLRAPGIYLSKNPVDLHIVGPRLIIDRHLHVVVILRDPRDVIVSTHARAPDRYYAPLRFWKRHIAIVRRLTGHPRFTVVRYESLVSEPDAVQQQLADRLPFLTVKARFSEFHDVASTSEKSVMAMHSLRPISDSSVGRWRRHLPRVAGQLAVHGPISAELIEFGYEEDESWLELLDGVAPDLSPSHLPDHLPLRVWQIRRRKYFEAATIAAARLCGIPLA